MIIQEGRTLPQIITSSGNLSMQVWDIGANTGTADRRVAGCRENL